jgi:DNA-binding NarL/FixJ family response regulator
VSITIVLAESLTLVRDGLRALLATDAELDVLADTDDGTEALRLVEQLRPTVLITDVLVRRTSGLELAREVRARHPATHVLVLATQSSPWHLNEALSAGAAAYVVKSASGADLFEAVRCASRGERYVSSPLSDADLVPSEPTAEAEIVSDPYHVLTAREREVVALAAEGRTNGEIGVQLGISHRTVEVHRANLMRKLGLRSQTELVRDAFRRGILSAD